MILEQQKKVHEQMQGLKRYLAELDYKDWYYTTAIKNGTEKRD